jgi:hypothetical protein
MLPAMVDDGHAIHYAAVQRGTPVYGADGAVVGKVDHVVDNYREHILDGFVIELENGELRFVDAPEVARTAERGVTLRISVEEAAQLPPPKQAPKEYSLRRGRMSRLLGSWKRR